MPDNQHNRRIEERQSHHRDPRHSPHAAKDDNRSHQHSSRSPLVTGDHHVPANYSTSQSQEDPRLRSQSAAWVKYDNRKHDIYISDRRGDEKNLAYGTNDSSKVPAYREPSSKRTLGQTAWEYDSNKKSLRHLSKEEKSKLYGDGKPLFPLSTEMEKDDASLLRSNFLPFSRTTKRKRSPPTESWIRDFPRGSSPDDSSDASEISSQVESDVHEDTEVESNETANLRKEHRLLEADVKNHPQDANAWRRLIDFQDVWVPRGLGNGCKPSTGTSNRTKAEITIALYQDAIGAMRPNDPHLEGLLLDMLREANCVWPASKLANQWVQLVKDHPQLPILQMEYVAFVQSRPENFTADAVQSLYKSFFQRANYWIGLQKGTQALLHTLARFLAFLRDYGNPELAMALAQALIEINFFRQNGSNDFENILLRFEEFWNLEGPRIGEEGARGWTNPSVDYKDASLTADLSQSPPVVTTNTSNLGTWSHFESARQRLDYLPSKTTVETEDEDPFHIVFFTDIRPYLFMLPTDESKIQLLDLTLQFLGLPPIVCSGIAGWRSDGLCATTWLTELPREGPTSFGVSSQNIPSTASSLFSTPSSALSAFFEPSTALETPQALISFARRLLSSLVDLLPNNDQLAEYSLALDFLMAPETSRKTAKNLLKRRPTRLRLYNAYALIEARFDLARALKTLSTAINLSSNLPQDSRQDCSVLWESLIHLSTQVSLDSAFSRLLIYGSDSLATLLVPTSQNLSQSNMAILRTGAALRHTLETYLPSTSPHATASVVTLQAYLAYLNNPIDPLPHLLMAFQTSSSLILLHHDQSHPVHILIHQSRASILHNHALTRPHKPALIRTALRESMSLYPDNALFPRLYAIHASSFVLDDRVRAPLHTAQPRRPSFTALAGAINLELHRPYIAGAAVRAAFERAVAADAGRHVAKLWIAYIKWETTKIQDKSRRGKDLFWRALREVPWSKMLVLHSLEALGDVFSESEGKAIRGLVESRGFRVFLEIEV